MGGDVKRFFVAWRRLVNNVLSIREGSDIQATIDGIKKDISFRGPTAWILILAIFIASIGLNVNSTAVIIGAMLISPLMGPILGVGLAVGTYDIEMLVRSLKNLAIAVTISLITSTIYFAITPLNIEQTELLARTRPTILDVLIALFGGFAGAIAGSRKEKTNVIPGVAIATALMPPLCTAGYGLATLKLEFFFGAFYLFFINSVFISLSTFIVVKYLRIPLVSVIEKAKLSRYRNILIAFIIITVAPSAVIFYYVIQETRFKVSAEKFISQECYFEGSELINSKVRYSDSLSVIDLYYIGNQISKDEEQELSSLLSEYKISGSETFPSTKKTEIKIHQEQLNTREFEKKMAEFNNDIRMKVVGDLYERNEALIRDKDKKIEVLEQELVKLSKQDTIPFRQLSSEMNFHFPGIERFSYARAVELQRINDSVAYDTISTFMVRFEKKQKRRVGEKEIKEIEKWLQVRMSDAEIRVIEY